MLKQQQKHWRFCHLIEASLKQAGWANNEEIWNELFSSRDSKCITLYHLMTFLLSKYMVSLLSDLFPSLMFQSNLIYWLQFYFSLWFIFCFIKLYPKQTKKIQNGNNSTCYHIVFKDSIKRHNTHKAFRMPHLVNLNTY